MIRLKFLLFIVLIGYIYGTSVERFCEEHPEYEFAPNPLSCSHFFTCTLPPVEKKCPPNRYIDMVTQKCEKVKPENCRFDDESQVKCPENGTVNLPHEFSCRKFIRCVDGELSEESCPLGEFFSPLRGICMEETKAECTQDESICPVDSRDVGQFHFRASRLECGLYYLCIKDRTEMLQCAPGLHFNDEKLWCESPRQSECVVEPEPTPPPFISEIDCSNIRDLVYVPHPDTCKHYFMCRKGESQMFTCPGDLIFDILRAQCNLRENNALCIHDINTRTDAPA